MSLNLFKLLGALLRRPGSRRVVLAEESNFPTDLYIAEGLTNLLGDSGARLRLVPPEDFEAALGPEVAVATLTQVDFRTGRKRDLRGLTEAGRTAGVPLVWDLSHKRGSLPPPAARGPRRVRGGLRVQVPERRPRSSRIPLCGP